MRRPTNQIHPMGCDCQPCTGRHPEPEAILPWAAVWITLAGGTLALLLDATGCTPAIAAALGMMS